MTVDILIEQFVKLIGYIAWPAVILVVLIALKKQIQEVILALGRRVATAKSLKFTKSGLELEDYIYAVDAKSESQQIVQDDIIELLDLVKTEAGKPTISKTDSKENLKELLQLADEYVKVDIKDWQLRVNKKNSLVRMMGIQIVGKEMDRDQLSEIDHDGIRAGLAGAIHFEPHPGDLELLLKVSKSAKGRHTFYRIVMGLGRLIDSGNVRQAEVPKVELILDNAEGRADAPLRKRILKTRALLRYTFQVREEE